MPFCAFQLGSLVASWSCCASCAPHGDLWMRQKCAQQKVQDGCTCCFEVVAAALDVCNTQSDKSLHTHRSERVAAAARKQGAAALAVATTGGWRAAAERLWTNPHVSSFAVPCLGTRCLGFLAIHKADLRCTTCLLVWL